MRDPDRVLAEHVSTSHQHRWRHYEDDVECRDCGQAPWYASRICPMGERR